MPMLAKNKGQNESNGPPVLLVLCLHQFGKTVGRQQPKKLIKGNGLKQGISGQINRRENKGIHRGENHSWYWSVDERPTLIRGGEK